MKKIKAILAMTPYGVIGNGDQMAWHHSGDFRRFKQLTTGNTVMLGYKTFISMLNHHTKTKSFLPGRRIVVIADPRSPETMDVISFQSHIDKLLISLNVTGDVFGFVTTGVPALDLTILYDQLPPDHNLLIAGGGLIFKRYLKFASIIHLTVIKFIDQTLYKNDNPIMLDPLVIQYIMNRQIRSCVINQPDDICDGVIASYYDINVSCEM